MPTVFTINGFRFYFYSNENDEPIHIHISKGEGNAKYWIEPLLEEYSYGFTNKQRREINKIISENIQTIKKAWDEHFR